MKGEITVDVRMVPGVCGNCRHWEPVETWGMCTLADSDNDVAGEKPNNPDSTAWVIGDHAYLTTRIDHGCNQWELKG